jgi:hypothetical protein
MNEGERRANFSATGNEGRCGSSRCSYHSPSPRARQGAVAIVKEVTRRLVLGKGLAELLRSPEGGQMCGDGDVHDTEALTAYCPKTRPSH